MNISSVLATIGVWFGVYLEGEKFSEATKDKGWKILLAALAAETLCTVFLIQIDSKINLRQKREILALERQIAPRRLTDSQQREVASVVATFPGQTIEVSSYSLDLESAILCEQIVAALKTHSPLAIDACMSEFATGRMSFGLHISGNNNKLNEALLTLFLSFKLAVSPAPPPSGPGISLALPRSPDSRIFVGVKPIAW